MAVIRKVSKSHCYRNITIDPNTSICDHGCRYCYMKRIRTLGNTSDSKSINIGALRKQLSNTNSKVMRELAQYRVVRIGAFSDISYTNENNYDDYRTAMQLISSYGYKYILVTKAAHAVDTCMLDDIRRHGCMLQVSLGYIDDGIADKLENVTIIPTSDRMELISSALSIGCNTVIRINPMHPDLLSEHVKVLEWYSSIGGERVILEGLRIVESWKDDMPELDFSRFVPMNSGGCYNNYLTPDRGTQEEMFKCMIAAARTNGIYKVTICGDHISNAKYGMPDTDCCQCTDSWHNIPMRDIEEDDNSVDRKA